MYAIVLHRLQRAEKHHQNGQKAYDKMRGDKAQAQTFQIKLNSL